MLNFPSRFSARFPFRGDSADTTRPNSPLICRPAFLASAAAGCFAAFLLPTYAGNAHRAPIKASLPIGVANGYAHQAAVRLAHHVNGTRAKVTRGLSGRKLRALLAAKPKTTPKTSPVAIKVANGYAHGAAVTLARQVNLTRAQVKPHAPTAHEIRLAAHQANVTRQRALKGAQLAKREQNRQARLAKTQAQQAVRVAKIERQNVALTSGDAVTAAAAFRGTRYVFGGTSRSGFDCSGFVRYILSATSGVALPRTATEQYYKGAPIPLEKLQPGDLVFFKNTYKHGISHVGIYAGEGKFIHAANSHKGVRTDNLNDSYYWKHYAGARRVLPADMRRAGFSR